MIRGCALVASVCTALSCHSTCRREPGREAAPAVARCEGEACADLADALQRDARTAVELLEVAASLGRACKVEPRCRAAALWRAARAYCGAAEMMTVDGERSKLATLGAAAARGALALTPGPAVEASYFLAVCLGIEADSARTRALSLVPQIVEAARRALAVDPGFERGGPLRLLGALYARAPAWPVSVGDMEAGLSLLRRGVSEHPGEPLNHYFLAEALLSEGKLDEARRAARRVLRAGPVGAWARTGRIWRGKARELLRRIERRKHHEGRDDR